MSEELAHQTLIGVYKFCNAIIAELDVKSEILNHFESVFKNWQHSWFIIRKWLLEIEFQNKEQTILSLVKKIPELQIFEDIIFAILNQNSSFWDVVFTNLRDCQRLLKTE